jgi:hypothetical protein
MINKGLSHYQSAQKNSGAFENRAFLEKIMEKGALYNIAFLQNRALLETILELPECMIDAKKMKQMETLLLWLLKTQEEARVS